MSSEPTAPIPTNRSEAHDWEARASKVCMVVIREMGRCKTWADIEQCRDTLFHVRLKAKGLIEEAHLFEAHACQGNHANG